MRMVATIQTVVRALGILSVVSSVSGAQGDDPGKRATVFGATGSGLVARTGENIGALGGLVGLELKLSDGISIRALASVQRGLSADNIEICRPDGLDGCLAILLPYWLSTVEANALVKPFPVPIRLVAGVGYAIGSDARETRTGAHGTSLPAEAGFVIRRGLEVSLGRSRRAPRLQYTHSDFRPDPFSLKRVESLTLLIVR
jgi:hypothetical protein